MVPPNDKSVNIRLHTKVEININTKNSSRKIYTRIENYKTSHMQW